MIDRIEILEEARRLSLRPQVVEKDYVLGWLLGGIAEQSVLGDSWVFKGGTCLKKCYLETSRFSEDLDFTVINDDQIDEAFLHQTFSRISEWVYDQTGIEIPQDQHRFDVYRNASGGLACQGRIYYRGPLAPRGDIPRIKVDLTVDEPVILEPTRRRVVHSYSDDHPDGIFVKCYRLEELFAVKIRALGERTRPRDLYDVIMLFRQEKGSRNAAIVLSTIRRKCEFKGIPIPSLGSLRSHRAELAADWESMLGHQLPSLPPMEHFWCELEGFFAWLTEA